MCRLSPAALPFLVATASVLLFARSASAALPPGYEDVMHCPPGSCRKYVNPQGMVGPTSTFNKCYDPATGDMVDGVWTGSLSDVVAPEGWVANPEACPEEGETDAGGDGGMDQYGDILTDCALQIGDAITCFTTSQEPACEGFDPMSLIGGDLPIDCDGGVELVCAALSGCCNQEITGIASCASKSQGLGQGLEGCDIDCSGGDTPPDPTSAGPSSASAAASFVLAALVATLAAPL